MAGAEAGDVLTPEESIALWQSHGWERTDVTLCLEGILEGVGYYEPANAVTTPLAKQGSIWALLKASWMHACNGSEVHAVACKSLWDSPAMIPFLSFASNLHL